MYIMECEKSCSKGLSHIHVMEEEVMTKGRRALTGPGGVVSSGDGTKTGVVRVSIVVLMHFSSIAAAARVTEWAPGTAGTVNDVFSVVENGILSFFSCFIVVFPTVSVSVTSTSTVYWSASCEGTTESGPAC